MVDKSSTDAGEEADGRVPASEVIGDLEFFPLEEGDRVTEAFVILKCVDADGEETWAMRKTRGMELEELLGALHVQAELAKRSLLAQWEED